MKKRYLFGLLVAVLAVGLVFTACDLFDLGEDDEDPETYQPLKITGIDSNDNDIEVEFTTERLVSASVTTAKAVAPQLTPQTDDKYKISKGTLVVSGGTIKVTGDEITFKPTATYGSATFIGTYKESEKTLILPQIPTTGETITGFYSDTIARVLKPTANPSGSATTTAGATVTLACATTNAVIKYTTDGTNPTAASATYSGAISVNYNNDGKPFEIRARAYKDGMPQSLVLKEKYSKPVATPTATPMPATDGTLNGVTVNLSTTTPSAKIRWTATPNGDTPPDPTFSGTYSGEGFFRGTDEPITIAFNESNAFKIKAIAIMEDGSMSNSEILSLSYNKKTTTGTGGITDMLAAGTSAVTEVDNKITISGDVRATGNIEITGGRTLEIAASVGKLTVPDGKTITVTGTGTKLNVKGTLEVAGGVNIGNGATLDVGSGGTLNMGGGNVTVSSGGTLTICADATMDKQKNNTNTSSMVDGILKGGGTITIESGGKMFIPNPSKFDFSQITPGVGKIVVKEGAELFYHGHTPDPDAHEVEYAFIGTLNSQGEPDTTDGADFVVVGSDSSITLTTDLISVSGYSMTIINMSLLGKATAYGPLWKEEWQDRTTDRLPINLGTNFLVNQGSTLTIGDGEKNSTLLIKNETMLGRLINNGTIIVSKKAGIKAETVGGVQNFGGSIRKRTASGGPLTSSDNITWADDDWEYPDD